MSQNSKNRCLMHQSDIRARCRVTQACGGLSAINSGQYKGQGGVYEGEVSHYTWSRGQMFPGEHVAR